MILNLTLKYRLHKRINVQDTVGNDHPKISYSFSFDLITSKTRSLPDMRNGEENPHYIHIYTLKTCTIQIPMFAYCLSLMYFIKIDINSPLKRSYIYFQLFSLKQIPSANVCLHNFDIIFCRCCCYSRFADERFCRISLHKQMQSPLCLECDVVIPTHAFVKTLKIEFFSDLIRMIR